MNPKCRITYYETAMVMIEIGGVRLLTDPVLDAANTGYDHGPVHLHKTSKPIVDASRLGNIDAVLLSHDQHADNLDEGGRKLLTHVKTVLTTPEGASRLGGSAAGLAPWDKTKVVAADGFTVSVTAVPARHGPDGTLDATGTVTGFLLEWAGQKHGSLYISGDTVLYSGTSEIAKRASVSVALLHIGRVRLAPMGDLVFSLSAQDAAAYALDLRARTVIPIHFEGWTHFSEGQAEASRVFSQSAMADRVVWLTPGMGFETEV